ncbi:MAG TPA: hypothetical protein VFP72_05705 [Kineosporiaceae bacterium]|nr:hypothetical protein [Kineosporiaceae bacterium]
MKPTLLGYVVDDVATLTEHQTRWATWHTALARFARDEGYALTDVYLDITGSPTGLHAVLDRVRRGGISAVVVAGTDTIPAQLLRQTVRVIDLHSMTP